MLEKDFRKKVIAFLKEKGAFVIGIEGLESGLPDLVFCWYGQFIGLELKVDHKLQPLQALKLKKIAEAGGKAWVLTYEPEWKELLWKALHGTIRSENELESTWKELLKGDQDD